MIHHPSLGRVASKAAALIAASDEAAEHDAAFDGGEWSGPAASRALLRALNTLAQSEGFADYEHLAEVISLRTSHRWTYFNLGLW